MTEAQNVARRLLAAAALFLLTALPAAKSIAAQTSSPEQALLSLLPYRLEDAAIPAGFAAFGQTAATNVALAFTYADDQRVAALRYLAGTGRITGIEQHFQRDDGSAPLVRLTIALYGDASAAAQVVRAAGLPVGSDTPAAFNVPQLGDGVRAFAGTRPSDDGASTLTDALVVWSRGRLLLTVDARGEDLVDRDAAAAFAQAADANAAGQSAALPAAPSDLLTEDLGRLDMAQRLAERQIAADAAPSGFSTGGSYVWSNEQLVLDSVFPGQTATAIAFDWRRITGEVEYFQLNDGSRTVLSSVYASFGDPAGAAAALRGHVLGVDGGSAVVELTSPMQLGEEISAYQAVLVWPGGEVRLSYTIRWRRGSLLLGVSANVPSGTSMPSYLVDVAQQLDDTYAANPVQ